MLELEILDFDQTIRDEAQQRVKWFCEELFGYNKEIRSEIVGAIADINEAGI